MSSALIWGNVLAWTLQIGLVAGLGALAPVALKLRVPRARLLYWQVLLVACLALPWVRSWRQAVVAGSLQVSNEFTSITSATSAAASAHRAVPFAWIALWLLAAGTAVRLIGLGIGLARLAAYRRRGRTMSAMPGSAGVALLLSDDVASPVTFGWRDPVVLLPADFPSLPEEMQEAILCHELLHVARRDWLFTIAEELVRAVLWFHPAIWWVIGEIQLAREQTVDQAVVATTQARGAYVDALLLMAGASITGVPARLDLAPAPMFLRRRHLRRRLVEVVKEVGMTTISKTRLICAMSAALVLLAAACWLATGAFPLSAAPQALSGTAPVGDSAGVAVNLNGSALLHRSPVSYPAEALAKGVEGTVVVQVKLDANGEVSDAAVLSGPDELRKGVLQSVLNWHFDKSAALSTRVVNIEFVKPPTAAAAPVSGRQPVFGILPNYRLAAGSSGRLAPPPPPPPPPPAAGKLSHIEVTGLSDSARAELLSQLPIQEGGEWTAETFAAVKAAANQFDSHNTVALVQSAGGLTLHISVANGGVAQTAGADLPPGVFRVGNGTLPPSVVSKVDPVFPADAPAGYEGSVLLSIVVGTDGKAENIQIVKSLGANFDANAIYAVEQWVFKPGTNQGVPVKVKAQIEVNYRKV